jgi:hypothetical protein
METMICSACGEARNEDELLAGECDSILYPGCSRTEIEITDAEIDSYQLRQRWGLQA